MPKHTAAIAVVLFALALVGAGPALALNLGESVVLDPATGNYVITYLGGNGVPKRSVYEPQTKISPFVASFFEMSQDGVTHYSYAVTNGSTSRQPIDRFSLDYVNNIRARRELERTRQDEQVDKEISLDRLRACIEALQKPSTWDTGCGVTRRAPQPGMQISWRDVTNGVLVGSKLTGFGFQSNELPGMVASRISGNSYPSWKEGRDPSPNDFDQYEISDDLDNQLIELARRDMDGIVRWAASPVFEVSNPFNGVPLLEQVRDHVKGWPQQQLMEQAFWQQIDSLLAAAINALKNRDATGAATSLAQIRIELRKKYPDLDVTTALDDPKAKDLAGTPDALKAFLSAHDRRLAAKVLDFDVSYVSDKLPVTDTSATACDRFMRAPGAVLVDAIVLQAPATDSDGIFSVCWSATGSRKSTRPEGSTCFGTWRNDGYSLEANGKEVYLGTDRIFRAQGLLPGSYRFQVRTRYRGDGDCIDSERTDWGSYSNAITTAVGN